MPKTIEGVKLFTVPELAKILNITTITVRTYLREGRLRGQKIGAIWHVSETNLNNFLEGITPPPAKGEGLGYRRRKPVKKRTKCISIKTA